MESSLFEDRSKYKYMLFKLGPDIYGTPLLQIREVIENREPKPIPNASSALEGMINLRGEVIGVIDIRKLLKVEPEQSLSILVFDSEQGAMGAVVDRCISVVEIDDENIEKKDFSGKAEDSHCFLGVGKSDLGLITLVSLPELARL